MKKFSYLLQQKNSSNTSQNKAANSPESIILSAASSENDKLLSSLNSSIDGISDDEALLRVEKYGANQITQIKKSSVLSLFFKSINPLNILLMTLALMSFFIGDFKAGIVISVMISLSVILTSFQEYRASKAIARLRLMVRTTATVIRKNEIEESEDEQFFPVTKVEKREIEIEQLVPGDVIWLSAGDIIPADVRLISAKDLFINQSSLTGESLPVEKSAAISDGKNKNLLELNNICYMGSNCVSGSAIAVVLLTGKNTFFGRIASKITTKKSKTNFDVGIKQYTWMMIRCMLVMVPIVFLLNGFGKGDWFSAFLFSVAVAVGLTPEVLPMIVAVNLGRGAISMSRNKVIVKHLSSIQNFGAMDVLCSDKTGTLTQDKVILEKYVDLEGKESATVLSYAYLNSFYQTGLKNLLDRAILEHGDQNYDAFLDKKYKKIDEIPFDFNRRRMSVVLEDNNQKHLLICKGAVEEMLLNSNKALISNNVVELKDEQRANLTKLSSDFSEDGFRVIAVAIKEISSGKSQYEVADEQGLTLIGFMAFLDPPKETTAEAISLLGRHGVSVKILTGDAMAVTKKICKDVGIDVQNVILGTEIDGLSDKELERISKNTTIFAKLSPFHKERIVKALQNGGSVVGFLGDGINDAAALKAADVGISVDSAVDIAKESADIVLLEKSLLVLEKGIIKGRTVFGNIIKYIKMGSSSNFGNMFSVVGSSWLLPFLPMLPIQILTNNLLYDFSQAAVATDNVDEEYLEKPRKWDMKEISRFMLTLGPISSIFDYVMFAILIFAFGAWTNPSLFQTGWFVYSLISQTVIVHIIRTNKIPFLQSRPSWTMVITSIIIVAISLYLPFSPFADSLGLVPLPWKYFVLLAVTIISYSILAQIVKSKLYKSI
ncbi:MAG: mgtA [Rickettsiaceae bacterium]|jgi:Mg2+-importing ATPase|nr:mgtA [Rickettsiaceae bacterium]